MLRRMFLSDIPRKARDVIAWVRPKDFEYFFPSRDYNIGTGLWEQQRKWHWRCCYLTTIRTFGSSTLTNHNHPPKFTIPFLRHIPHRQLQLNYECISVGSGGGSMLHPLFTPFYFQLNMLDSDFTNHFLLQTYPFFIHMWSKNFFAWCTHVCPTNGGRTFA